MCFKLRFSIWRNHPFREQICLKKVLPTGVRVIGVNSGYTYSFIKDVAEKFRWASSPAEGSQFRSRDVFPRAPAAPSSVIAYVDGYGNLKTTIAYDARRSDQESASVCASTITSMRRQ